MSDRVLVAAAVFVAVGVLGAGAFFFLVAGSGHDRPVTATPWPVPTPTAPPPPPPVAISTPPTAPPAYWPDTQFDVKRFDAEGFVPSALADARKVWKDATLVWVSAVDVDADGVSDLTIGFGRGVSYAFRSAASSHDAGMCVHWVYVGEKGVWSETNSQRSWLCTIPRPLLGKPRCTVKQAFTRVAAKFPAKGRAKVLRWSFDPTNKGDFRADWSVDGFATVTDDAATDMSWGFADDDCSKR